MHALRQTAGRHSDVTAPLSREEDTEAPAPDHRSLQLTWKSPPQTPHTVLIIHNINYSNT